MCGIGGILRVTRPGEAYEPIPESWLDALDAGIAWRGPDGAGRFRDKVTRPDGTIIEVALVHRRLSIIDHEGGAQPMVRPAEIGSERCSALVFNGCIYSNGELRDEFERDGYLFTTDHSDTETLLAWCLQNLTAWMGETPDGEDPYFVAPDRGLEGMFALAFWSSEHGELLLFGDRFGEKPLLRWESSEDRTAIFASTAAGVIGGIRAISSKPREIPIDRHSLIAWVRFGFSATRTPLQGIECGPWWVPSWFGRHWMPEDPDRWYQLILGSLVIFLAFVAFVVAAPVLLAWMAIAGVGKLRRLGTTRPGPDEIEAALNRSVANRLEADVPIGCFLSGGVDSSLVALYAAQRLPGITTITMRIPDERFDESRYAERVAEIIGSDHITVDVAPTPAEDLVEIIQTLGLPFGDSSILPTYWLCRAAREHMKVALAGDGGDELYWGYERYAAAAWLGISSRLALRPSLVRLLTRRSEPSRREKWRRLSEAARGDGYLDLVSIFPKRELSRLIGRRAARRFGEGSNGRPRGARSARDWDMRNYLPGDLMRKVDTASMLCGLEIRCPMLDSTVVELANRCPKPALRNPSNRKALLRNIARRHFPPDLVDRPKQGFAIPIGEWFRTDYGGMRTLLMDLVGRHAEANRPAFGRVHDELRINMRYVDRMIREHMESRRDHSQRLFMLCSLAIWARWLDRR